VDVVPDLAEGKRYLEITIDREKAARYGVNASDVNDVIETAIGGDRITQTLEGDNDSQSARATRGSIGRTPTPSAISLSRRIRRRRSCSIWDRVSGLGFRVSGRRTAPPRAGEWVRAGR